MTRKAAFGFQAVLLLAALSHGFALAPPLAAADPALETYVEKLQEAGFPDLAVDYLRLVARRPNRSADFTKTLDYDLGKALMVLAERADPETERKSCDEAAGRFRKVLTEHAATDEAIDSLNQIAYILLKRGQRALARADLEEDAKRKAGYRADARGQFELARNDFDTAIAQYEKSMADRAGDDPAKAAPGRKRRDRLADALVSARMNRAMVEYQFARTFDAKDPKRKESLAQSDQRFAKLAIDTSSGGPTFASQYAKFFQGRTALEGGSPQLALDLLEEVLSAEDPRGKEPKPMRDLLLRARISLYETLNAKGEHKKVIDDPVYSATAWVRAHPNDLRTVEGLGIQLELAKAMLAVAQKSPAGSRDRAQAFTNAQRCLNAVVRTASPYAKEAFRLRNQFASEMKTIAKPTTFEEAVELAAALRDEEKWKDAAEAYQEALKMAVARTDAERIADAYFWIAYGQFKANDLAAAVATGEKLLREQARAKRAPDVADVMLAAQFQRVRNAAPADRPAAADQLAKLGQLVEGLYGKVSVADKSRRLRGYAAQLTNRFDAAATAFASIAPESDLFPEGQLRAAQSLWTLYNQESTKPPAQRQPEKLKQWSANALAMLEKSATVQRAALAQATAGDSSAGTAAPGAPAPTIPTLLVETELSWGELCLRLENMPQAAKLIDPLLPLIQQGDRKDLEPFVTRLLIAGLDVANSQRDFDKADRLVEQVVKQGTENPGRITVVLIRIGKSLEDALKQHRQAGRAAQAAATLELFKRFLARFAARPRQDYPAYRYLSDAFISHGEAAEAVKLHAKMLERLANDPSAVEARYRKGEILSVRVKQVVGLRDAGQFIEALAAIDQLLKESAAPAGKRVPFPLRFSMERARVLQAWADRDPSKVADAHRQWATIQNALAPLRQKPVEFFESRYGLGWCLAKQGKADEARRILKGTLALTPNIGSDALKTKYEELIKKLGG